MSRRNNSYRIVGTGGTGNDPIRSVDSVEAELFRRQCRQLGRLLEFDDLRNLVLAGGAFKGPLIVPRTVRLNAREHHFRPALGTDPKNSEWAKWDHSQPLTCVLQPN